MESRQQRATTALLAILTLLMLGLMARPAHAQTGPYSAEIQRALRGARAGSTLLTSATPSTCTAADLVDTQLWSFNLPANTLNEDGKAIRVSASFALGVNANSKTVNFRVGGTTIGSRVTTQNGGATATVGTIIRTGAATETAYGDNSAGTGGTIVLLASDTTFPIILTAWGQNGTASANDVCLKTVTVELLQTNTSNIVTSTGGSIANPILFPNGTAAAPSLTFAAATDAGLYRNTSLNGVGISQGGSDVAGFNASTSTGLQLAVSRPFSWSVGALGAASDLLLYRDAAQTLAQRNGTNPQTFRLYSTFTDASNYERLMLNAPAAGSGQILMEAAGTGTVRALRLGTSGNASLIFRTNSTDVWQISGSGHLLATTDNTVDIGASGANRPRNIFVGTDVALNGAGALRWEGSTRIRNQSDGVLTLFDNASATFDRLQFGGTGPTFPAIKKNGTSIEAKLADDSAYTNITSLHSTIISALRNGSNANATWISATVPTIASGFFSTGPSITTPNGTAAFVINVGTVTAASSGVINLPTAATGWNCYANNITAAAAHRAEETVQIGSTTATATFENQNKATGAATNWTASDLIRVSCFGY